MKSIIRTAILGISIILSVVVLSFAITYFTRAQDTVSVTGLGEATFTSDLIVWNGYIGVEAQDPLEGYKQIAAQQEKLAQYLSEGGVADSEVTFNNVTIDKEYESVYANGNYTGQRFTGYSVTQRFEVTSTRVDEVEALSRQVSSLIAKGVNIASFAPEYYCTRLDEVKLSLIEKASQDAYQRASNIAKNAGGRLGKPTTARLGVFQITSPNGNEEYSYGGCFNTSSKEKKARITVRMEYRLK